MASDFMSSNLRRHLTGIALVLFTAIIWIAASFFVQSLENEADISPYCFTTMGCSAFVVLLPIALLKRYFDDSGQVDRSPILDWQTSKNATILGLLIWLSQFTFNISLDMTSVSSNTIVSSAGTIFTYVLTVLVLKDQFEWLKLFYLFICIAGTVLVSWSDAMDKEHGNDAVLGDCIALVSALIFAIYSVTAAKRLPMSEQIDIVLVYGFCGVVVVIAFWPLGLVLVSQGIVRCRPTLVQFCMIFAKGIFANALGDLFWMQGALLIGPTIATIELALQWPIAFTVDALFFEPAWLHDSKSVALITIGSILIFAGFVGINIPKQQYTLLPRFEAPQDSDDNKRT